MKTINIKESLHKELKLLATSKNIKIKELVEIALEKYIKEEDDADLIIIQKNKIIKEYYK
jgi:hypothetical protein